MKTRFKDKAEGGADHFWFVAVLFILIKLAIHLITNTNYQLHRDEMLYFNMADHLSFGYATVPPVTGFIAYIVKSLFGFSVFGVRLIPALLGAASLFLIAKIVRERGGGILALTIASAAFLLSPGFLLFDLLFTPNVIEQFLWLLTTYFVYRMISESNPKHWIIIGILTGLGFLTKYSVAFFLTGLIVALVFSSNRKMFLSRYFVLSILTGIIIILPNLLWQYNHSWPVILHMTQLKSNQLDNFSKIDFLTDLISLNSASTVIWIIGLGSLIFRKQEVKFRSIGIASLLILLLFVFAGGKGYYVLGIIPFLFAWGGYMIEKYTIGSLKFLTYPALLIILSASIVSLPCAVPLLSFDKLNKYTEKNKNWISYPFSRWEDGKIHPLSQVYSDMTGWDELAEAVSKTYSQLTENTKKNCTILAEGNYGAAGAIHFYGRKYSLPEAITFSESYVFWAPDSIPDGPVIYINKKIGGLTNLFSNIKETGCVNDKYFRENGLKVFLCSEPKTDIQEVYRQKAKEEKGVYCR